MTLRSPASLVAACAAAVALALAAPAGAGAVTTDLTGQQQLAFLNAQRAANGLPAGITENAAWSEGCRLHMNYLEQNDTFGHSEDPAKPGYTDAGRDAAASSVLIAPGDAFTAAGANAFEHAPIHLMQMLNPYLRMSGVWGGCLSTQRDPEFGRPFAASQTFSYPGDGATRVPVGETAVEGPFVPGAFVGLATENPLVGLPTGPHLYFFYAGPEGVMGSRGRITAASLTGPGGAVDVRTVDGATTSPTLGDLGPYLAPGGILIPVEPLQQDATYTASVTFQPSAAGSAPVSRTWRFSTGDTATAPITKGSPDVSAPAAAAEPAAVAPTPVAVAKLRLSRRALTFSANVRGAVWVTIERRTARKRGRPARWKAQGSFSALALSGANRLTQAKPLAKGRYRVRVRAGTATGSLLASRTFAL